MTRLDKHRGPFALGHALGRAFCAEPASGGVGLEVRAYSLEDPAKELASKLVVYDKIVGEMMPYIAVLDDTLYVVTASGFLERFDADLKSIDRSRISWSAYPGFAGGGRHILTQGRKGNNVRDLRNGDTWPIDFDRDSDTEAEVAALDASGSLLVIASYGRYSGKSVLVWRDVGVTLPEQREENILTIDEEVVGLAIGPTRRHLVAVSDGEQAFVMRMTDVNDDDEDSDDFDQSPRGLWKRRTPGTLHVDFLDEERVVLAGRGRVAVCHVEDGVVLAERPVDGRPVALVSESRLLWTCTTTGFRALSLP